ncbi:MAG: DUF2269 family protein [Candidatus Omnitrophota bacterium]|nr:DUF2269 family protein [Candidatus Omnitrophota bacterium]
MSAYAILKFVHVLLAIAAVGSNITYGVWLTRAARDRQHLGYVLQGVKILDDRVANPAYGLLFVTGVGMIVAGKVPWQTPWLLTSLMLYAGVILLGLFGYTPLLRRQIAALQAKGPEAPDYQVLAGRAQSVAIVLAVLVVVIVFFMVTKPALWS